MPPPAPVPFRQFVGRAKYPDGPAAGDPIAVESEPAQRLFVDAVSSGRWKHTVLVAPSQRGKTLLGIILPTLWAICENGSSVGYVMPSMDKLNQNWEGKIKPAIVGAGFGAWLPAKGPGARGGRASVISLRNPATGMTAGRMYFMASGYGNRETAVSSVSPDVVVFDESDDVENAGKIQLVLKRLESHGANARSFVASTVNEIAEREGHPILDLWRQGTASRIEHRCPLCDAFGVVDFEQLDADAGTLACRHCKQAWTPAQRIAALNGARLAHANPDASQFSLLTTAADYRWEIPDKHTGEVIAQIPRIAADYRAALIAETRGDPSLMATHMRKVWCRPYTAPEPEGEMNHTTLHRRSMESTMHKRTVPAWAHAITMGVDVQGDRNYWLVSAHGSDDRSAVVDWGYEMACEYGKEATPAQRRDSFDALHRLAEEGWQVDGGEAHMTPCQRWIDCGFLPDEIANWVQGQPQWKACRGVGHDDARDQVGGSERTLHADIRVTKCIRSVRLNGWKIPTYRVDGHHFRMRLHAALMRSPGQPASCQLPTGLAKNDALLLHLSGEVWDASVEGRKAFWRTVRRRHDWLDCLIYAAAAWLFHRYHGDNQAATIADPSTPPPIPAPDPIDYGGGGFGRSDW